MKKKLLIGLLASLAVCTVAAACGESKSDKDNFTLTLRDGNPMLGGTIEEMSVEEGAALELPSPTAEGKIFKGWIDVEGNPAPATMPEEALALFATWEIIPYNVTVVNGEETTTYKFGVDYDFENGIEYTVSDLKNVLKDALPENTEEVAYVYAEGIPETFELQSYAFTVTETTSYELTVVVGDPFDPASISTYYMAAGAELDLDVPMTEGKTFAGWVTITYEIDEWEMETEVINPAPATMPEEALTVHATWNVIPYTITVTLPDNAGTVTVDIGIEDVYDEDWNTIVYDYTNGYGVEYAIGEALKKVQTETVAYEVEGLTYDEEGTAVFSELKNYEFTAKAVERVYTVYLPDSSTQEYKYGDTIELPTPEPMEGAEFVKWVYYAYNEELGDFDVLDVPETATGAIDEASFKQIWNVTPYTLTIKQEGQEDMVFTFGAMTDFENGIESTVEDLARILSFNLPESTEKVTYSYSPEVPETFALQNYEFTIVETPIYDTLTIPEAIELGKTFEHNTYSTDKYYVTGIVKNVYNTQYGNMYIVDEDGNELTVYGTYDATGEKRYDAMANAPQAGDTVKLLSVVGLYSNAPQLKNAWILEVTPASDAAKIAIEKAALTVTNSCTGATEIELATAGAVRADVVITWTVVAGSDIATYADGKLTITNPAAETTVTVKATLTCGETKDEASFNIVVSHKDEGATEPSELAVFEFGANGSAAHVDGNAYSGTKSYTENGYTLSLTGMEKVYGPAYDAKGNSCIKLGTSSVVGKFSFTVPENVTKVVIKVAKYKANTTKINVNGTAYTINTNSNDGAYTDIEIDTTTTKTVSFATVSGGVRAMVNSITFIGL